MAKVSRRGGREQSEEVHLEGLASESMRVEAKNSEERGGEGPGEGAWIHMPGWERSMKGNKSREGLKGREQPGAWRIILKIKEGWS